MKIRKDLQKLLEEGNIQADEYIFKEMKAPPLTSFIPFSGIQEMHQLASSIKYSSKIDFKYERIEHIMDWCGFTRIGRGTNRVVYRHLEHPYVAAKIAIDDVGIRDNPREFINQDYLYPFVTKIFEVDPSGTVALVERDNPCTNREEFSSIAEKVFDLLRFWFTGKYVMEDVGSKFFMNWGTRIFDGCPVLHDYPYMFELDYHKLHCQVPDLAGGVCNGIIDYDDGYNHLVCGTCGATYRAIDLAKAIKNKIVMEDDKEVIMKVRVTVKMDNGDKNIVENTTETKSVIQTRYESASKQTKEASKAYKVSPVAEESNKQETRDETFDKIIRKANAKSFIKKQEDIENEDGIENEAAEEAKTISIKRNIPPAPQTEEEKPVEKKDNGSAINIKIKPKKVFDAGKTDNTDSQKDKPVAIKVSVKEDIKKPDIVDVSKNEDLTPVKEDTKPEIKQDVVEEPETEESKVEAEEAKDDENLTLQGHFIPKEDDSNSPKDMTAAITAAVEPEDDLGEDLKEQLLADDAQRTQEQEADDVKPTTDLDHESVWDDSNEEGRSEEEIEEENNSEVSTEDVQKDSAIEEESTVADNISDKLYLICNVCGIDGIFSSSKPDRDRVAEDELYAYDFEGSEGNPSEVDRVVIGEAESNYCGTVILVNPLDFGDEESIELNESNLKLRDDTITYSEFVDLVYSEEE